MGYTHPSGPNLIGHPQCGPGMIYDHNARRCISLTKSTTKRPQRKTRYKA